ncbi:MAG: hypothetical protein ACYDAK_05345 [Candidatus Limnocylindrales bacterium]
MSEELAAPAILSRFADPTAVRTVTLPGGCRCPGTPHDADTATIRTELGSGEMNRGRTFGWQSSGMTYYDWEAANDWFIAYATTGWNLERADAKGHNEPVPITRQMATLLDEETRQFLMIEINGGPEKPTPQSDAPPNGSGRSSRGSSPASASRTRTTRKRR